MSDDEMTFDPYNSLNKEITLNEVQSILKKYGLPGKVNNLELYKRAFIHRSYTRRPQSVNEELNITLTKCPENCMDLKQKSNERLEFLGDGVLDNITKYYLYRRFPKENEGFMTEKKIALVNNESIGKLAYEIKLNKWFIMSRNAEEKNTRHNLKKLGCLFEAFLGAIFLDHEKLKIDDENGLGTGLGFRASQIFVENIYEKHVNWMELIRNDNNYKNILQVKIQKQFKITPDYLEYEQLNDEGYHMGVYLCIGKPIHMVNICDAVSRTSIDFNSIQKEIDEIGHIFICLGKGIHKQKKKAEQLACEEALNKIEINK